MTDAAVFLPAPLPRQGRLALWRPDGGEADARAGGAGGEIQVVRRWGSGARRAKVPARLLTVAEALPWLTAARHDPRAHPAAAAWGAAALHALQLTARGRLLPGLTPQGADAWRAGPLDADDLVHLRAVAAALPWEGRAVPLPGAGPPRLPEAEDLLRAFLDAVADTLPRTPGAALLAGGPYAAKEAHELPRLADWAAEVAAGADAGVRLGLRLHLAPHELYEPDARPATLVVQVHSLADPTLLADASELWSGAVGDVLGPRARVDTVLALRRAARLWPPLERLLALPVPDRLLLAEDELSELLGPASQRLAAAGIAVHWPKTLVRSLTATAVVRQAPGAATQETSFFDADRLLQFRWQVSLAGVPLTEEEMDRLAQAHRPMVRLRDQWVVVDPALVRKARRRNLGLLDPLDALSLALTGEGEVDGERVAVEPQGVLADLRAALTRDPGPVTSDLPLRDYQLKGLAWLDRMTSLGLGCCLADDMGLGKTLAVIALQRHRRPAAPVLVVCPASLLGNWQREIEKFAPGLPVHRYHGAGRSLALQDGAGGGFVLTTYGTMRASAPELAARDWAFVVADEAQHIKNPYAAAARALRTIPAPARIALTGTPVENNLSELWAILDWTTPGLLGGLKNFRARHARLIESEGDEEALARLARLIGPFVLRRRKSDPGIVPELPPKTETDHPVALAKEQAVLYEAVVREGLEEIAEARGMARRGLVMKLLGALKQICNHPAQFLREPAPALAGRSGKLELLDELLETILAEDDSVLVFTQYVTMGRLLQRHLIAQGIDSQLLHGGTPLAERQRMVDRFQSGGAPVFLLSLKAAGTGLNLTRAGHVVHYDRWWNPAVEEQATDRAYRIGQTRPVQVHRLITEGTVEERIDELLHTKRALSDAVLGHAGEAGLTELTHAELAELVALREAR
ncbi:SNF2-related protein [Streptomyces polyrhachis]|uniref:SNF2-related protein n=1 Tax=Streptomyces polyrhachis TaxID=1282885 RepID=A0ABW2G7C1_9ACTN